MNFRLEDHSEEVLKAMNDAVLRGLEKCGLVAEGYAKKLVNSPGKKGTGYLRNSITHTVSMEEKAMYVGSDVDYASFIEVGTGVYGPAHTSGYWVYVVGGKKHESKNPGKRYTLEEAKRIVAMLRSQKPPVEAYYTNGQPAKPFIKPAVADHADKYMKILRDELKGK